MIRIEANAAAKVSSASNVPFSLELLDEMPLGIS